MASDVNGRTCMTTGVELSDTSIISDVGADKSGNVDSLYNMNDTFKQYSPQNSQIVHILTEIGTPVRQNVNIDDSIVDSQDFQDCSQGTHFMPNQDFIAKLDLELIDLPRDSYIVKLIELTNDSDDTITWYRSMLTSRAKSIQGCPLGKLITRKSTNRGSSSQKYAKDCYLLQQFISGDPSSIDEVFRKDEPKSVSEPNILPLNCHLIELRTTLHMTIDRLNEVEKLGKANRTVIEKLQTDNEKLRRELEDSNDRLCKHLVFSERKYTQYEANLKLLNQQSKAIGEFDFNMYSEKIKQIDSEQIRHSKLLLKCTKSFNELKMSCQQSYATKVNPHITPESIPVISTDSTTHSYNLQMRSPESEIYNGTVKDSQQTHDTLRTNVLAKIDDSHKNDEPTTFKIPVRLQGATAAVQSTDDNFFTGVSRKRSARYYLSGIDSKSTRSGIMTYLESRDVQVTYLRLFQSRNSLRYVSAKLNVSENCANIIEGENFWPIGVRCRCWLSNQAWYQRGSEAPSDQKQDEKKKL
ncbi:unnamed protein product [Mytilus edulis]|uniref:Uncharacterized protein n=1 Tax=Mytilus edulis TaxID=6550 RepID=A0A8S3SF64_MYTED|nr:unnamed protein product [Mytilus edulis]